MIYKFALIPILILSQWTAFGNTKNRNGTNVEAHKRADQKPAEAHKRADQKPVEAYVSKLTLKQKVGQLFVFGFSGQSFNRSLKRKLKRLNPGSIIIFKRNINNLQQISALNAKIHEYALKTTGLPALIMVDQEGGSVTRIKTRPNPPSAMAIGELNDLKLSREYGYTTGQLLNLLNFNMNLAPVADLSNPIDNSFIGNRSFGKSPLESARLAQAYGDGLFSAGILPTFKHFPGHGGVSDSHKSTPENLKTLKDLEQNDLVPYKEIANAHTPSAVMVAHVSFPNIDSSRLPATFSKKLVNEVLQKKLNYKGLVLTDDLEMYGAEYVGSVGERAIKAVLSGCDLIMVAWSWRQQKKAYNAILKAVKNGVITKERLNESVKKIVSTKLKLRESMQLHKFKKFPQHTLKKKIKNLKKLTNSISYNIVQAIPLRKFNLKHSVPKNEPALVISADYKFYSSFKKIKKKNSYFVRISRKKSLTLGSWFRKYPKLHVYYYVTGQGSARKLKSLSPSIKRKMVIINSLHPGAIENKNQYKAIIDIYSRNYLVGKWLAEFISTNSNRFKKVKTVKNSF